MENILVINGCVRPDSRTHALARAVLERLPGRVEEIRLYDEVIPPLDLARLQNREECVRRGDFSGEEFRYAKQFASADTIIIAVPYWDLLFPAVLRCYLEAVTVTGITFRYTPEGFPQGLCRARRLVYVTTAGGPVGSRNFGFAYVKELAQTFYGIGDVRCLLAEGLDLEGADVPGLMEDAKKRAADLFEARL